MAKRVLLSKHPFSKIKNKRLRTDLYDALYFIAYLIEGIDRAKEKRYKEEFLRVIILYIASVVEALCLFLVESNSLILKKEECSHIRQISMPGVSVETGQLVIAIQKDKDIKIRDLPFAEAIKVLSKNRKISDTLYEKLNTLRTTRNTQHLYSRKNSSVSNDDVKNAYSSLDLLLKQI
ncbi:MAG: hypothetical protein UX71_C0005G0057 [Parcubacteria group bacterium GW2011_GWA1_47_10]|uniref:HEPN domain-containing protein n=1 Tax=Candidatus Zambryskibacteria bacterium RIFCSPHIGHO2_01_FULL_46_25 TaxID=1802738 RepID=A0A1G2SZ71_9BACT|nr:MAG: hypothetical protein UX71_C0005G0057 [Parcubacteria group bacterium GW2011_GWA1_47_10]OHA90295.1 MAG: hypothetical protein A2838_01690 [Candidatus Zambryskibacteria bacterium RIFCSPHIGHO2_01_FULL_46_25]OHB06835.1 MAG: hypothetical protein A3A31_00835 [Candidatus Zambryskibacteria bacterium RIFCSPLOWO2_01_FULL_48_25]